MDASRRRPRGGACRSSRPERGADAVGRVVPADPGERARDAEREQAAAAQHARDSGTTTERVGERSSRRDRRRRGRSSVRERQRLGARSARAGSRRRGDAARVLELPRRVVEARRSARTAAPSRIDHCAAPQPSSSTSLPATSPSTWSSALGQLPDPPPGLRPADVLAVRSLVLVGLLIPEGAVPRCVRRAHRGTRGRSRARPTRASRSRGRGCSASRARTRRGASPGSASAGFVAPIVLRAVAIAPSPSSTNASVGPEVMKSTSSPKNGFSPCSA